MLSNKKPLRQGPVNYIHILYKFIHIYVDGNAVQSKPLRQGPVNYLRNLNLADTSVLQV